MPAKSGLRPGDVIELDVEKAVYRGQGLGRHEGQVVFVPRAVPGDRVRVRIEAGPGGLRPRPHREVIGPAAGPSRRALSAVRPLRRLRLPGLRVRGPARLEGGGAARDARPRPRGVGGSDRRASVARGRVAHPRLAPRALRSRRPAARPPRGRQPSRHRSRDVPAAVAGDERRPARPRQSARTAAGLGAARAGRGPRGGPGWWPARGVARDRPRTAGGRRTGRARG